MLDERRNLTHSSKDISLHAQHLRNRVWNHCRGPQRDGRKIAVEPPSNEERKRQRESKFVKEIEKKNNPLNAFSDFHIGGGEESARHTEARPSSGKNVLQVVANLFN